MLEVLRGARQSACELGQHGRFRNRSIRRDEVDTKPLTVESVTVPLDRELPAHRPLYTDRVALALDESAHDVSRDIDALHSPDEGVTEAALLARHASVDALGTQ